MIGNLLIILQLLFIVVFGAYLITMLKSQKVNKNALEKESGKELIKLKRLRNVSLTKPLTEETRPASISEVIGQEQGIKALKAALCGPNPQHIIIYGPAGVGKTAAARVILEEAKKMPLSPFNEKSKFVEIDAATLRFDERGIADPLIGSVHDPIYQGAGAYGPAGIPQPKPGAVTKAHGGVLFLDEIGELHSIQLNKLLKVLEDRKVFLESSYYSSENTSIPLHIHEIFQNGFPADFRLIGATTRSPEEIPYALRSRCVEIFFKPLTIEQICKIAKNAIYKNNLIIQDKIEELIAKHSANGREAINIVQTAGSIISLENRNIITRKDIEWVIEFGKYTPRVEKKVSAGFEVGMVNGLAVNGYSHGSLLDIEAIAQPAKKGAGTFTVTGIAEEEEVQSKTHKLKRSSNIKSSISNMLTIMKRLLNHDPKDYNIHINFPSGMMVDGPSAGIAITVAVYSAITNKPIDKTIALTGEISILGKVKPVGGVTDKIQAAICAGIKKVIIPKENWQEIYKTYGIKIVAVEDISQVIKNIFTLDINENNDIIENNIFCAKKLLALSDYEAR